MHAHLLAKLNSRNSLLAGNDRGLVNDGRLLRKSSTYLNVYPDYSIAIEYQSLLCDYLIFMDSPPSQCPLLLPAIALSRVI